jgi:hypothetical protein
VTVTYPLLPAALAAERIADLHRTAARRRTVLAALRARRRRAAAASDQNPATQTAPTQPQFTETQTTQNASAGGYMTEHLCDAVPVPNRPRV